MFPLHSPPTATELPQTPALAFTLQRPTAKRCKGIRGRTRAVSLVTGQTALLPLGRPAGISPGSGDREGFKNELSMVIAVLF